MTRVEEQTRKQVWQQAFLAALTGLSARATIDRDKIAKYAALIADDAVKVYGEEWGWQ